MANLASCSKMANAMLAPMEKRSKTRRLLKVITRPIFLYPIVLGNLFLIFSTTSVFFLEKDHNPHMKSYWDSLWWGVTTITTVGFGDIVPITWQGRLIGMVLMYTGTVLFVTFTGMLVTYWLKEEVEREVIPIENEIIKEEQEQHHTRQMLELILRKVEKLEKEIERKNKD